MFFWIMIKLLIFDLDNTLYDEKSYVESGFKAVAKFLSASSEKFKEQEIYDALIQSFETNGRGKNFDDLKRKYPEIDVAELVKVYREHLPKIIMPHDVLQCLKSLKESHKMALLTNGWPEVQKQKVAALGLEKIFDKIFYAQEDGLEFRKPHKRFFEKVLEWSGLSPEEILMIGDDVEADIIPATQMGMQTFLVEKIGDFKKLCLKN